MGEWLVAKDFPPPKKKWQHSEGRVREGISGLRVASQRDDYNQLAHLFPRPASISVKVPDFGGEWLLLKIR